jgi:hypothetical protein
MNIHISRRSQRAFVQAFLSMLLILGIIYHGVKHQEEVMLQQLVSQQNRTLSFVTNKMEIPVRGLGNIPFQLGVDEKRKGIIHSTRTTPGHEMIQLTFPNITLRIYTTKQEL